MSVKIRLTRMGKKKQPSYRVVVVDSRRPRDGRYIEQIGRYDPRQEPSLVEIDNEKALAWLRNGAQPTDRARKLLEISGAWTQFKVAKGEIHTIDVTPAEAEEEPAAEAPSEAPSEEVAEAGDTTEASGPEPTEDHEPAEPDAADAEGAEG